jgi:hypothetical protein
MATRCDDIFCYSIAHVRDQITDAEETLGFHIVRFYSAGGRPSREPTETIEEYYYFPSGGTIRDREMNIIFYEPRLDKYHVRNADAADASEA